jgi:transcriptional regulator with XRE-family HTH domain
MRYRFDHVAFREARLASGKKQEQIALALGVSAGTVIRYEAGVITPPTDRLCQLCEELGCAPEDLLRPTLVA